MPDNLPDLSKHNSYFSDAMKGNEKLYASLKSKKTSKGVTLGHCIKTGVDNPGRIDKSIFLSNFISEILNIIIKLNLL